MATADKPSCGRTKKNLGTLGAHKMVAYLKKSCWLTILRLDPVHDCWWPGIGPPTKTRLSYNLWPKSRRPSLACSSCSRIRVSGWCSSIGTAIYHRSQIIGWPITHIELTNTPPLRALPFTFVKNLTKIRRKCQNL